MEIPACSWHSCTWPLWFTDLLLSFCLIFNSKVCTPHVFDQCTLLRFLIMFISSHCLRSTPFYVFVIEKRSIEAPLQWVKPSKVVSSDFFLFNEWLTVVVFDKSFLKTKTRKIYENLFPILYQLEPLNLNLIIRTRNKNNGS